MKTNLQWLRAVAATLVVLFHVALQAEKDGRPTPLLQTFGAWGEAGVDIFFVISGFVMVLSQARNRRSIGAFLLERAVRIVPMYWLLTAVLVSVLVLAPSLFNSRSFSLAHTLVSFSFTTWTTPFVLPVLYVGWTLEYELLFYLAFALSFALVPLRWCWVPVAAFFIGMSWAGLVGAFTIEFVYGMLLALAVLSGRRVPGQAGLAIGVALAGMVALAGIGHFEAFAESPRHLRYGVPAFLIVGGLLFAPQLGGRAALFLGGASYSIYLTQVFTLPVAFRLVPKLGPLPYDLAALLIAASSVAAGCLAHQFVERPMTRALNRRLLKPAARPVPTAPTPS